MPTVPSDRPGSTNVDLTGQISSGDDITDAIQSAMDDNTRVYVPGGSYEASFNDCLSFDLDNATLYGDPDVQVDIEMDYDGDPQQSTSSVLQIENINVRGQKPEDQYKIDIEPDDGTIRWVNFNFPDGTDDPTDSYVARCDSGNGGAHEIINCYIGPHGNSAFYYTDKPGGMDVVFDGCAFFNCNGGPWRGSGATIRNTRFIHDGTIPGFQEEGGDFSPGQVRTIKCTGGDGVNDIINCDFYAAPDTGPVDGPFIDWDSDSEDSDGFYLENTRMENHTDRELIDTGSAPGGALDNSDIGPGNCFTTEPIFSGDSVSGDWDTSCTVASSTDGWEWTPLGEQPGDIGGGGGGTANTIVIENNSGQFTDVQFTVQSGSTGRVDYGSEAESGTDEIIDNGDGTTTIRSVDMDPGAVDSYIIDGLVLSYSIPVGQENIGVTMNGNPTSFKELVDKTTGVGYDHTLTVRPAESNTELIDISVTTSGEITHGPEAEPWVDPVTQNDDGTWTATTRGIGPGRIDSWHFNGEILDTAVSTGFAEGSADGGQWQSLSSLRGYGTGDGNGDGGDGDNGGTTPNQAPLASFTASASNQVISFDASGSSDPDGSISGYTWTVTGPGGSTTSYTGSGGTHNASGSPGTYNIKLTVADNAGATDTQTANVTVSAVDDGDGGTDTPTDDGPDTAVLLGGALLAYAAYRGIKGDGRAD